MRFIEETEAAWSAEQLAAAEREIEEQKREWEQNRLAAMREEAERRARELEEENDLLTFPREDATNQVSDNIKKVNKTEIVHKRLGRTFKNRRRNRRMFSKLKTTTQNGRKIKVRCYRTRRLRKHTKVVKKPIDIEECSNESVSTETKSENVIDSEDNDNSVDSITNSVGDNEIHRNGDINDDTAESEGDSTCSSSEETKIVENYVDHNSPRTRSRGTVAINLWTLDVSPILPGVKPVKSSNIIGKRDKHKSKDDTESENEDTNKKITVNKNFTESVAEKNKNVNDSSEKSPIKRHLKKRNGTKSVISDITVEANALKVPKTTDNPLIEDNSKKLEKIDDSTTLADLRRALAKKLLSDNCKDTTATSKIDNDKKMNCVKNTSITRLNKNSSENKQKNSNQEELRNNAKIVNTDHSFTTLNEIKINCTTNCNNDESQSPNTTNNVPTEKNDQDNSLNNIDITKENIGTETNLNKINDNASLKNKSSEDYNCSKNILSDSSKLQKNTAISVNHDLDKKITTKPKRQPGRVTRAKTLNASVNNERQSTIDTWVTTIQKTTRVDKLDDELTLRVASNHDANKISDNEKSSSKVTNKRTFDDTDSDLKQKNIKIIKTE